MISEKLLYLVLNTCRGKSNLPIEIWSDLRQDINDHLSGKEIDFIKYRKVTVNHTPVRIGELNAEIRRLKRVVESEKKLVKIYRTRESDMMKVLRRGLK